MKRMAERRQMQNRLTREDFDGGPVSLDEIEPGLFLGNLTAATNWGTLKSHQIRHILTLDSVPLPQHIVDASFLTTKYVQISDMPKEDILHHLDQCLEFIGAALAKKENILVHCYFGVSRSSAVVIAYIMKHNNLDYQQAYEFVKSKRVFVEPNAGFISQLKLYRRMGCRINGQFQKYKIYRLRLAGEQVRKAKILPNNFNNLIQPDPAITQTNPEPSVYRCRKCRRVVATRSHVLVHAKKGAAINTDTKHISTVSVDLTDGTSSTKNKSPSPPSPSPSPRLLDAIAEQIRNVNVAADVASDATATNAMECKSILFVEPIAWMKQVPNSVQGRLHCPKCEQKLGSFSWINGCQCPCGEHFAPAFYLIPSKVELSKTVQNVQTTI